MDETTNGAVDTVTAIGMTQMVEQAANVGTITLPEVPVDLHNVGAVLTPAMLDEMREQLAVRPTRDPDTMWVYPTTAAVDFPEMVPDRPGFGRLPRGIVWDNPARFYQGVGQREVVQVTADGRTADPTVVEVDLNGAVLSQHMLDEVYSRVAAARLTNPGTTVDIHIRRVNISNFPRLIADTGYIYELLVKMIDEREAAG